MRVRFLMLLLPVLWPVLSSAQTDLRTRNPVGLFQDMQADTVTSDLSNHFAPTPHIRFHVTRPVPGEDLTGSTTILVALDFNDDGITDFLQSTAAKADEKPSRLWLGQGDGTFAALADSSIPRSMQRVVAGDLDNDGWTDLVLVPMEAGGSRSAWSRESRNVLPLTPLTILRNLAGRKFVDMTAEWLGSVSITAVYLVLADWDQDGWLDLAYNRLGPDQGQEVVVRFGSASGFRTRPEQVLPVAATFNVEIPEIFNLLPLTAFDVDADGDQDLLLWGFMSFDRKSLQADRWIPNQGGVMGEPLDLPFPSRMRYPASWADVNNDGLFDAFAGTSDFLGGRNELLINQGPDGQGVPTFSDRGRQMGLWMGYNYCQAVTWADWDNDGWLDLCQNRTFNEGRFTESALYLNDQGRRFVNITARADSSLGPGSSVSLALDADRDGDLDLLLGHDYLYLEQVPLSSTGMKLVLNESQGGHWLEVKLTGTRSNRSALGGRVTVCAGDRRVHQYVARGGNGLHGQPPLVMHFGLGEAARADSVLVRWPNGQWEKWGEQAADQRVVLTEGAGESRSGR